MLNDYLELWLSHGKRLFYGVTVGGGLLLCLLTGWIWWHYHYLNPQNVFWGAVNNNLIINGVTKHTEGTTEGEKLNQYEQITLGAQNFVKTQVTRSQEDPKSTIVTQTLGTPQANFATYTKIDTAQKSTTGQALNFDSVLRTWSKADVGATAGEGSFATAIFDVIPFSHLNSSQRNQVVKSMKDSEVYTIDFNKVSKERKNGRLYYSYDASINPGKYIALLKQVDSLMGLNQLKELDPSQYQGGEPVQLKITVDAKAHQLASLTYASNNSVIEYSSWGVSGKLQLPNKVVTQAELQAKLNAILSQ